MTKLFVFVCLLNVKMSTAAKSTAGLIETMSVYGRMPWDPDHLAPLDWANEPWTESGWEWPDYRQELVKNYSDCYGFAYEDCTQFVSPTSKGKYSTVNHYPMSAAPGIFDHTASIWPAWSVPGTGFIPRHFFPSNTDESKYMFINTFELGFSNIPDDVDGSSEDPCDSNPVTGGGAAGILQHITENTTEGKFSDVYVFGLGESIQWSWDDEELGRVFADACNQAKTDTQPWLQLWASGTVELYDGGQWSQANMTSYIDQLAADMNTYDASMEWLVTKSAFEPNGPTGIVVNISSTQGHALVVYWFTKSSESDYYIDVDASEVEKAAIGYFTVGNGTNIKTYEEAKTACELENGKLASIPTAGDAIYAYQVCKEADDSAQGAHCWVDLVKHDDMTWHWPEGEADFSTWTESVWDSLPGPLERGDEYQCWVVDCDLKYATIHAAVAALEVAAGPDQCREDDVPELIINNVISDAQFALCLPSPSASPTASPSAAPDLSSAPQHVGGSLLSVSVICSVMVWL